VSLFARTGLFLVGSLVIGPLVLGPTGIAEAANGQVCMGIVIDDGPNSSEPDWSAVAVQGANVPPGTSDLQAMSTAGDTATQNDSGLVCAINNFPADGLQNCLNTSGDLYYYWSYWEGDPYTNTWTYANVGPASHTVGSGQTYVEGWRYQDPGPDSPSATKPSVSPSAAFAQACPGVTPVPSGSTGGSGGSGGGGGDFGGGTPDGGAPSESDNSPGSSTTPSVGPTSSTPTTKPASGGATTTTTTTRPGSGAGSTPSPSHVTTTTFGPVSTPISEARSPGSKAALASSRQHSAAGGGDPALPIVVVVGVILLLGGLAWWRWRRRPVEE
jgi:hypothetical protein